MSTRRYYAHTKKGRPPEEWEPLRRHLEEVAECAERFAQAAGADARGIGAALVAGRLHDLGKYDERFQDYLRCSAAGRPAEAFSHKHYGAAEAARFGRDLAIAIAGHHGGLPDTSELGSRIANVDSSPLLDAACEDGAAVIGLAVPAIAGHVRRLPLNFDLHTRLLFSCLVDADALCTEQFVEPEKSALRVPRPLDAVALARRLDAHLCTMNREGPVNALRREVLVACRAAGALEPGFFSLTVPTGGGKTLASMAFALEHVKAHAKAHGLRRILYVIPYVSIIEQNADVFREALGEEWVLEHHSLAQVEHDERRVGEETVDPAAVSARLATEDWDAPVVVTTTVQFFESLFSNRPGACRKLHNIARSVVIFDECQTLPPPMLEPILDMLRGLTEHWGVSMVFCTATQPAFGRSERLPAGLDNVREIAPDPQALFCALRRTRVHWPKSEGDVWDFARVSDEMLRAPDRQALCVVNTKAHARELFEVLRNQLELPGDGRLAGAGLFHLSTAMFPAHRTATLKAIRARLHGRLPCLVAATQLVEAGVDLDFPVVLRALAPMDSIAQAAGRCNREGSRAEGGEVHVFVPEHDMGPPGWYETAREVTRALLRAGEPDIHDPELYRRYFKKLYPLGDLDARGIQGKRRNLAFAEVAEAFHIIDKATVSVAVREFPDRCGDVGLVEDLLAEVRRRGAPSREILRKLQPYTLNLYRNAFDAAHAMGHIHEFVPSLWVLEGRHAYREEVGVDIEESIAFIV